MVIFASVFDDGFTSDSTMIGKKEGKSKKPHWTITGFNGMS